MKLGYPCPGFKKIQIFEKKNISKYMFIVHIHDSIKEVYNHLGTIDGYQKLYPDRKDIIEFYAFETQPSRQDFKDIFGYEPINQLGWSGGPIYEWVTVKYIYLNGKSESESNSPEEIAIKKGQQESKNIIPEIFTTYHYICPHCKKASEVSEKRLPSDIRLKFSEFIAKQKDIPADFAQIVNDHFWDLI